MEYYEFKCIHCQSTNVIAAINDGGSVQYCNNCKKTYKAKHIAAPTPMEIPTTRISYAWKK